MSIPVNRRLFLCISFLCLLLFVTPALLRAMTRPPTLDPTYGLPLPPTASPAAVSTANWIWAAQTEDHQTVLLRRTFTLPTPPKTAILSITADDFFTLFVNGKQVNQSVADPADDNVWQHVHRLDLTPFLMAGRNVLAVRAVNTGGAAGLVARLEMTGQPAVETDAQWKVYSEAAPDGWTGKAFDDTSWQPATLIAPLTSGVWAAAGGLSGWPGYDQTAPYLAHITIPFAHIAEVRGVLGANLPHPEAVLTIIPPPIGTTETTALLLDCGKEIAGRVQIDPLTAGTVQVGTGESEQEAILAPWGGQRTVKLVPGTTVFTSYSAFRYVQLVFPPATTSAPAPIRLRVTVDHKYYPVQYRGSFACSDPLLTKLWYMGAYTAHLCMQEDIWDAPKRDRARWIGDLHVSGETINNAFADTFLMEQTLQRLRDEAQGGQPATAAPRMDVNGIPGYSAAWICCLADFHRHIGDYNFLRKQHDSLLSLLGYMQGEMDDNNLFVNKRGAWPFADWSPGYDSDQPPARAATDLFFVKAAQEAAFLLREMGDTTNAAKYAAWAVTLTDVAQRSLPDPTTQTYGERLQENAMAIYSGVATPAQQEAIYQSVLRPGSDAWDKTGTPPYNAHVITPYYANYVIFAMSLAGHNADTMRVLRDYWGGMVAEGSTTCWEAYDPQWPKTDFHANLYADGNHGYFISLCHGWSSGPTNWLTERVLGVRPTSGGFQTVEIAPDLGDLTWAEGDVPTPHGLIHVRVEKKGASLNLSLSLPPGVRTTVILSGRQKIITGGGKYNFTGGVSH